MKDVSDKCTATPLDEQLSERLGEIAVTHGLKVPETVEEVRLFEEAFSGEIANANHSRRDLVPVLALAKELSELKVPLTRALEAPRVPPEYLLAARNGVGIAREIEDKMDAAIQKAREKIQQNER